MGHEKSKNFAQNNMLFQSLTVAVPLKRVLCLSALKLEVMEWEKMPKFTICVARMVNKPLQILVILINYASNIK